jgi:DNA-nicking Smr family endonuclease
MPKSKAQSSVRSLKDLNRLIPSDRLLSTEVAPNTTSRERASSPALPGKPEDDNALFLSAMADVQPLGGPKPAIKEMPGLAKLPVETQTVQDDVEALTALVREGKNFRIEYTSEYIEGRGYRVPPEITRRLHQGRFAIQDHLDLHGHSAVSAEDSLGRFFKKALQTGKHAVLVIHGRGRSSAAEPVLKRLVQDWLKRGPFRKHMVAYASARPCDGGTGATYVLLRQRPFTKRFRKKLNSNPNLA